MSLKTTSGISSTSLKSACIRLHLWFSYVTLLLLGLCPVLAQTNRFAPGSNSVDHAYLLEHYTKHEYKVPMRDGVKLFTAVYTPKDDSRPYPILLTRTPYSLKPYGEDLDPDPRGLMQFYAREKFIFALQDVRVDRKSTRLNSSHMSISYAVFCLKKKKT